MFKRVQKSNPFDSFVSPGVANVYVTRGKRSQTTDAIEGGTSLPGEPHLSGSAPPRLCQYDPDGNLVSDGVFAYCYDSASRLTTVTSNGVTVAAFAYDAFGNTIAATGPLADTFPHRFSTKYFDSETGLSYYGYRYYSPSLMRWLNRDPIEETGGVNLYVFCKNQVLDKFDNLGNDIYLYTGHTTGRFLLDLFHQVVAADIWSQDCPPRRIGKIGFSFRFTGKVNLSSPSLSWLNDNSIVLPGLLVGEIYDVSSVEGELTGRKRTTPEHDRKWIGDMIKKVGTTDVYSCFRHNCRTFSQREFDKIKEQ